MATAEPVSARWIFTGETGLDVLKVDKRNFLSGAHERARLPPCALDARTGNGGRQRADLSRVQGDRATQVAAVTHAGCCRTHTLPHVPSLWQPKLTLNGMTNITFIKSLFNELHGRLQFDPFRRPLRLGST